MAGLRSVAPHLPYQLVVHELRGGAERDLSGGALVEVGEAGLPEFIPGLDRDPPVISRVSVRPNVFRVRRARPRAHASRRIRAG